MSRIGKMPVPIPKGVDVRIDGGDVSVKGPLGNLSHSTIGVNVKQEDGVLIVTRDENHPKSRAMWGLMRTLISNIVVGVSEGFSKKLLITGTGYKAEATGDNLTLNLGFSHPVVFRLPEGVVAEVTGKQNIITLKSIDKVVLGDVAAKIRDLRPVEPYNGKGVAYEGEKIRRKEGKAAVGGVM